MADITAESIAEQAGDNIHALVRATVKTAQDAALNERTVLRRLRGRLTAEIAAVDQRVAALDAAEERRKGSPAPTGRAVPPASPAPSQTP